MGSVARRAVRPSNAGARDGDARARGRALRRRGRGGGRGRVRVAALRRRHVQHLRPAQRDQPHRPRRAGARRARTRWCARCSTAARRCARETGGAFDARAAGLAAGLSVDPTGLVKGWAVERAAALLEAAGARRFLIDAGGDVVVRGGAWRVGIRHPRRRGGSRPCWRSTTAPSPRPAPTSAGPHIVDPRTGRPARGRALGHRPRPRPRHGRRVRHRRVRDGLARARLDRRRSTATRR